MKKMFFSQLEMGLPIESLKKFLKIVNFYSRYMFVTYQEKLVKLITMYMTEDFLNQRQQIQQVWTSCNCRDRDNTYPYVA